MSDYIPKIVIPVANEFRFVSLQPSLFPCDVEKDFRKILFANQNPLNSSTKEYFQLVDLSDMESKIQFYSSYNNHTVQLLDINNNLIDTIQAQEVPNQEVTVNGSISGNIITIDGSNGNTPEQAQEWLNNQSKNGLNIFVENSEGLFCAAKIVSVSGTQFEIDKTIDLSSYNNQIVQNLKHFKRGDLTKFYELKINWSQYQKGYYQIKIQASNFDLEVFQNKLEVNYQSEFISEPIFYYDIESVMNEPSTLVSYKNNDTELGDFEIDYSTGIEHKLRVPAYTKTDRPQVDRETIQVSGKRTKNLYQESIPGMIFQTGLLPEYVHYKLTIAFGSDSVSINKIRVSNEDYQISSFQENNYSEGQVEYWFYNDSNYIENNP